MSERARILAKKPEAKKDASVSRTRKTDLSQSMNSPADRILHLQRTIGNQAVARLIRSGALQAKLRIGQPGDVYEQEADRVADAVMRMPEPQVRRQVEPEEEEEETLQSKPLANQITPLAQVQRQEEPEEEEETLQSKPLAEEITLLVQRQVEPEEEEEEEKLQRQTVDKKEEEAQTKATSSHISEVSPNLESRIHALRGSGQPLANSERAFFEPRFGQDFSQVRVHTDAQAAETAQEVNARAYTVGKDMVFGAGQYAPETASGRRLLAHELVHVMQQKSQHQTRKDKEGEIIQMKKKLSKIHHMKHSAGLSLSKLNLGSQIEQIQLYPASSGGWKIKVTKPRKPPDILVPNVTSGYDVDGDLSYPSGLLSLFRVGRWYLEGIYSKGGYGKRVGTFHSVISEGDDVTANDLQGTTKEGTGYLVIAAQLLWGNWIEDRVPFQAYMHGWVKPPSNCINGPKKKVFLNDVKGPITNPKSRKTSFDLTRTFSQGWSSSASVGTSYSQAISSQHGFNVGLGGEIGNKVAKGSANLGYSYSRQDTKTIETTINSTMAISGTASASYTLHIEPGEVGALVPWGEVVAFKIPSIKTNSKGWVIDKTGHLVLIGMKVKAAQPIVEKMKAGETEAKARERLQKRIDLFKP